MKKITLILLFLVPVCALGRDSVLDTIHNLSRSGPGTIKSLQSTDACGFCHVPHTGVPAVPLWGQQLSSATYQTYKSDTLDSRVPQPNGSSKLCLSCHDGTITVGSLHTQNLNVGTLPASSSGFIGTDISGDHPISMVVDQTVIEMNNSDTSSLKELKEMTTDSDGVKLDGVLRMQCTSCHNPHSDKNYTASEIHFWRKSTFSEACLVCHTP